MSFVKNAPVHSFRVISTYHKNNVSGFFSFFIKTIYVYFQELTEASTEWIAQIVIYSIDYYNFYWNGEYQKFWIHVYTKGIWMGCFRLYLFYMVNSKYCIFWWSCFFLFSPLYSSFYFAMVLISTFITTPLYCYYLRIHDCMMSILGLFVVIASSLVMVCDSENNLIFNKNQIFWIEISFKKSL